MKKDKPITFKIDGKKRVIKEYTICDTIWSQFRGLMFRPKNYTRPLLFVFKKEGSYPIHSFFCRKFIAVWMLKRKIIDVKVVEPWKLSVTPKEKFDELLEIPLNSDELGKI
jgi:uncharacterized membrane protein (UPF0127 family)